MLLSVGGIQTCRRLGRKKVFVLSREIWTKTFNIKVNLLDYSLFNLSHYLLSIDATRRDKNHANQNERLELYGVSTLGEFIDAGKNDPKNSLNCLDLPGTRASTPWFMS